MNELTVREHGLLTDVELMPADIGVLRSVAPKINVIPSMTSGLFDIGTTSWIGAIQGGTIALRIVPKIPIERVLFMIAYSVTPARWQETLFKFRRDATLVEMIAPVFVQAATRALERGIQRGYQQRDEALLTVRGRVRFSDQIRHRYGRFPPAEVTYDDFTEDIDENRLLRAAVDRLGRLRLRSPQVRRSLRSLDWRFQNVSLLEYNPRRLPEVQFTRLNERYRPAIRLAELILQSASFRLEHGVVRSSSFLIDMNDVFEDFVRIALREALGTDDRHFPKGAHHRRVWLDRDRRIKLEPDLSWWIGGRCSFVGDVKYKRAGAGGANNPDAYQALAYSVATGLPSAMLVYASAASAREVLRIPGAGKTIDVRSLDLAQEPEAILRDIASLARDIRASVVRSLAA